MTFMTFVTTRHYPTYLKYVLITLSLTIAPGCDREPTWVIDENLFQSNQYSISIPSDTTSLDQERICGTYTLLILLNNEVMQSGIFRYDHFAERESKNLYFKIVDGNLIVDGSSAPKNIYFFNAKTKYSGLISPTKYSGLISPGPAIKFIIDRTNEKSNSDLEKDFSDYAAQRPHKVTITYDSQQLTQRGHSKAELLFTLNSRTLTPATQQLTCRIPLIRF